MIEEGLLKQLEPGKVHQTTTMTHLKLKMPLQLEQQRGTRGKRNEFRFGLNLSIKWATEINMHFKNYFGFCSWIGQ